jgi:capsular exopolysaccharide synthesis family protein
LTAQIGGLQGQVDDANAAIARLEAADDDPRVGERERLLTQRGVLLQRASELQAASTLQSGGARVVRSAEVPAAPSNPQPARTLVLGLIAGAILGMAVAFVREYFDDSLTSPTDLDKLGSDIPLLAVVPVIPCSKGRSVGIVRPGSTGLEAFRSLRTNIEFVGVSGDCRVLEVVSAQSDEGKSTVAANLGVALAHAGRSVVLIDADLRAPRLHRFFQVDVSVGLSTVLAGAPLEASIQRLEDGLFVVVAGAVPPNPSELLAGGRLEAVIDELRLQFDYVIIDSAPLLPVSDGLTIARYVDGVIVVAQSGRTKVGPLDQTLEALDQIAAPVLGLVLNRVNARTAAADGYTYGSEYGARSKLPPEQLPKPTALEGRPPSPKATGPGAPSTTLASPTTSSGAAAAGGQ